jgi:hypothetical protein
MKKIRVEGIKLSDELLQVNLRSLSVSKTPASQICQLLTINQINMPFLSMTHMEEGLHLSLCVTSEDSIRVRALLESEPTLTGNLEFIPAVGLLSLFPHQSSLKFLGLSLCAFKKAHVPLYGMASSISALTFITDYAHLDRAVASLEKYLDFPPNFAPYRPEIHIRQNKVLKR